MYDITFMSRKKASLKDCNTRVLPIYVDREANDVPLNLVNTSREKDKPVIRTVAAMVAMCLLSSLVMSFIL